MTFSANIVGEKWIDCQGQKLDASVFNDDYCDCPDGSDEPGTSACAPVGKFKCENVGHVSKFIKSSQVADGICDCCDGSDEAALGTICPNNCKEIAQSFAQKKMEKRLIVDQGLKAKSVHLQSAKVSKFQREQELLTLEKDVQELESRYEKLKKEEEAKQILVDSEIEKICKPTIEKVESYIRELGKSVLELGKQNKQTINSVSFNLDELKSKVTEILSDISEKTNGAIPLREESQEGFKEDDVDHQEGQFTKEENEFDVPAPHFNNTEIEHVCKPYREKLVEWAQKLLKSVENEYLWETTDSKLAIDLSNSKKSSLDANAAIQSKKNKIAELQKIANLDFGPEGVFEALHSKCLELTAGQYTYEVCFFGSATQKFTGQSIHLGSWAKWTGPAEDPYSEMLFENGTSCWNGPSRSLKVHLKCGIEEKVLSVSEPAQCEYYMDIETPAVCSESSYTEVSDEATLHIDL